MNLFKDKIPDQLFHTYFIENKNTNVLYELLSFLEERGIKTKGNPDFLHEVYEALTVREVPYIEQYQNQRSITNGPKICIIESLAINHEAYNAILKMLEEPRLNTHFFFLVPNPDLIPATLASRAHIVHTSMGIEQSLAENAEKFLKMKIADRMEMISQIVADYKKSETSAPLRHVATQILDICEANIHQSTENLSTANAFKLEQILKSKKYLSTPGASVKMILEHIALVL